MMESSGLWRAGVLALVLTGTAPLLTWGQLDLQYQPRSQEQLGSWKEGVKPKPVSGLNIELISALADYQESLDADRFPNFVKLQFFLESPHEVYVTVRELDFRTYYWLDKVHPQQAWETGFQNIFSWPADPVLQRLTPKVELYDLGALIRLDADSTSSLERVAPGVLYAKQPPATITGYFFTLKTGEDARLSVSIRQQSTGEIMETQIFRRERAGRPFTIHWKKAQEWEAGLYTMEVIGFSLSTNQTLSKDIRFYHQPTVNP